MILSSLSGDFARFSCGRWLRGYWKRKGLAVHKDMHTNTLNRALSGLGGRERFDQYEIRKVGALVGHRLSAASFAAAGAVDKARN